MKKIESKGSLYYKKRFMDYIGLLFLIIIIKLNIFPIYACKIYSCIRICSLDYGKKIALHSKTGSFSLLPQTNPLSFLFKISWTSLWKQTIDFSPRKSHTKKVQVKEFVPFRTQWQFRDGIFHYWAH